MEQKSPEQIKNHLAVTQLHKMRYATLAITMLSMSCFIITAEILWCFYHQLQPICVLGC